MLFQEHKNGNVIGREKERKRLTLKDIRRYIWLCAGRGPRNTKLDKFCETFFKLMYESSMMVAVNVVLWPHPWFWNVLYCWHGYPDHHHLPAGVWWLYMVEMCNCCSMLAFHFYEVRRNDFWALFIHHCAAIFLMVLSWTCNLWRVGTLVLWSHKQTDGFLNAAKLFKYAGHVKASNVTFAIFAVVWMSTKMSYYQTVVVYSVVVESSQFIGDFPAYNVFGGLLTVLALLNVMWTFSIAKVIYMAMIRGNVGGDPRSDDEESEEEERGAQE